MRSSKMFNLSEQHYTVQELAQQWRVSADTIRRRFRDELGVLHLGNPKRMRRTYDAIRIPSHIAERVYRRLTESKKMAPSGNNWPSRPTQAKSAAKVLLPSDFGSELGVPPSFLIRSDDASVEKKVSACRDSELTLKGSSHAR